MELENQSSKQVYIQLLAETLKKKTEVLKHLIELTQQQETVISSNNFSEDEFLQLISLKDEQLQILNSLDDGFDKLYDSVKEELTNRKDNYVSEIEQLKELITQITNFSVTLQAMEARNKSMLEVLLTKKRENIKQSRISSQTVSNYYKTMSQQHEEKSYFYDKKN